MATNPSEVEMQTQAEIYFRYGESAGEISCFFAKQLEYQVSVKVFRDGTAVIVDWEDGPGPLQIVDRMVDFLFPERNKHGSQSMH